MPRQAPCADSGAALVFEEEGGGEVVVEFGELVVAQWSSGGPLVGGTVSFGLCTS